MFNLKQFLSGRTLWVGGADGGVAEKYPLANFNCSFVNIRSWDDLGDLFYLLLVGTGVGFKSTKEFAAELPPIRTNVEVKHELYTQRYPLTKEANTTLHIIERAQRRSFTSEIVRKDGLNPCGHSSDTYRAPIRSSTVKYRFTTITFVRRALA
jgi:hypothetical protein